MAFVTAVPLAHRARASSTLCSSTFSTRTAPTHRSRVAKKPTPNVTEAPAPQACAFSASSSPSSSADISIADTTCDLDAVYAVWTAVAASEGVRAPPREDDDYLSHTTTHLLARSVSDGRPVGAGRLVLTAQNARLDRVCVVPDARGAGIGRAMVARLLKQAGAVDGVTYVNAARGSEMAFFSILGFDPVGDERVENGLVVRTMMLRSPVCAPVATGACAGLHHASIRVSDIERSLAFYGALGLIVSDKFLTSNGARACYVEGLGARLELVEMPDGNGALAGVQGVPPTGFDRLVFDVTKACTDLQSFLQHLKRKNGGQLEIAAEPAQQVLGKSVVSVAAISDPDGLPIEFFRTEAQVPGELRTRITW